MTPALHAHGLTKRYGTHLALDQVSFDVPPGRIVGLLGPNGAGKTTLLQALLGLIPAEGELQVLGHDPRTRPTALMEDVSFIADVAILPRWLKVSEAVRLVEGLHPRFNRARCEAILTRTTVPLTAKVRQLSKGMIVQLHLALVMAIDAKVLILDEPTLGLDLLYRKAFYRSLLEDYCDQERTVVVSTHQVEEVESILTDVLMLREGRVVLQAPLEDLQATFLQVQVKDPASLPLARELGPLDERQVFGQTFLLYRGVPADRLHPLGTVSATALSDVFVAMMGARA